MPTEPCLFNWLVSLRLPGWWRKKFWESFGLTLKKSNIAIIVVFSGRFRQIFLPPPPPVTSHMTVKAIMASTVGLFLFLFSVAFVSGKDLRVNFDDDVGATCGYDVRLVTHFSSIFFLLRSPTSRKCFSYPKLGESTTLSLAVIWSYFLVCWSRD